MVALLLIPAGCAETGRKQSPAHEKSAWAVIDPAYSADSEVPERDVRPGAPWLYGPVELESWKHQQMRISSKAVAHHGHYPGAYHDPFTEASFRLTIRDGGRFPSKLEFQSNGDAEVLANGISIYHSQACGNLHRVKLPGIKTAGMTLQFNLKTAKEPPALLIPDGPLSTAREGWEWLSAETGWLPAAAHPQTRSGVMPHLADMQEVILEPVGREGILYDFGRELIGFVTFRCAGTPSIIVGESQTEALDTVVANHEQILHLDSLGDEQWVSRYPLAFRYVQVIGDDPDRISCRAQFSPARYHGAFACSDSLLTRIWMTAAYTHRINKYEFMLDGIKRDRLPWVDNMLISSAVEAFTFADPEILRRTLAVLGRESDKSSINNIIDYDALWLISQDAYQLQFDDPGFLRQEWPRIYAMIERIADQCDENGLRRWPPGSWIFIDWVPGWDKNMAEQVMWWWAQQAGIRLAGRMGEQETARKWTERANAMKDYLNLTAWNQDIAAWTDPDRKIAPTRHGNLLSMVSGLSRPDQFEGVMRVLEESEAEPLNSPSMFFYEIRTLARHGQRAEALARLKDIWRAMLDPGSTSFWEGYDPSEKGDEIYRFYGRPYGKSMCHAWSAGPVVLLPEIIFGIQPLSDGWKTFSIDPIPGLVDYASFTQPTRYGNIEIEITGTKIHLMVPGGTTAIFADHNFHGPKVVDL